jgi:fucose permease
MAIIGGAVFPAIMGRISDKTNIQAAFIVPLVCYVYIVYFSTVGHKPSPVPQENDGTEELEGLAICRRDIVSRLI